MTRRTVAEEGPDPIDVHVGGRLKQRRMILGLSQSDLGKSLNVTFQQVQKYERGANRLSASQLWRAADALKVDLTFFFSGLSEHSPISPKELTRHHAEMLRALELLSADTGRAFAALASAVVAERERDN